MRTATLGASIILAQMAGDRPATITKVYSNDTAEACGFMPMPEHIRLVKLHPSRAEAINAGQRNSAFYHGYWPAKD